LQFLLVEKNIEEHLDFMRLSTIILILAVVAVAAFVAGRQRALVSAGGAKQMRDLHSLPNYYGYQTAIAAVLPALALLIVWLSFADQFIVAQVVSELPVSYTELNPAQLNLVVNDIRNLAVGAALLIAYVLKDRSMLFILILVRLITDLLDLPTGLLFDAFPNSLRATLLFVLLYYIPALFALHYLWKQIRMREEPVSA
jgi:hypothetical protein